MKPGVLRGISYLFVVNCALGFGSKVRPLGQTVDLGDVTYFLPGYPEVITSHTDVFSLDLQDGQLLPITVIPSAIDTSLSQLLDDYTVKDDVYSDEFSCHIFHNDGRPVTVQRLPCRPQLYSTHYNSSLSGLSHLPPGPYFAQINPYSISIFKAYRVYPDPANAFYYGTIQDPSGVFQVLSSNSPLVIEGAAIAVPSRLYFPPPSAEKPLSGVRMGVKDVYDLKGLRKSVGNRAWFNLYPAAEKTAPCIQYLTDLGAVVVGKTRTSQFGNGQEGTADWVDFSNAFNARGDGYQSPSSSSSGAGSAQSNYDWIDMNIGSDTGGSVRAPAAVSGVFGNRPSQNIMTLDGAGSMSVYMDTPAFMASSAADFAAWGRAWYGKGNATLKDYDEFPRRLIYPIDTPGIDTQMFPSPGFFPAEKGQAHDLYEKFTAGLEKVLGTHRTELDFYTQYKDGPGSGLYPVQQLGSVWGLMTSYEQYHGMYTQLVADWAAIHDGDRPYVDPPVATNMEYASRLSESDFATALANKTTFKDWLEAELLTPQHESSSCSSALLIHPIHQGTPSYRDEFVSKDRPMFYGWNQYGISQLGGVPEVVIPLGEAPYVSRITGTRKKLPVAVAINAAAGCDLMLFRLVEALEREGVIPSVVGKGSTLF